jgi:hypothetical protein
MQRIAEKFLQTISKSLTTQAEARRNALVLGFIKGGCYEGIPFHQPRVCVCD